jgi:hypothetical protein
MKLFNFIKSLFIIVIIMPWLTSCSEEEGNSQIEPQEQLPIITSFEPDNGGVSSYVFITGENFESYDTINVVKFNGVQAKIIDYRPVAELLVEVPAGATTGSISIETSGGQVTSISEFTVNLHLLDSVIREKAYNPGYEIPKYSGPGEKLLLMGENFSKYADENIVKINGTQCQVEVLQNPNSTEDVYQQFYIYIPDGATSGTITHTIGSHTQENDAVIEIPTGKWTILESSFPGEDRSEVYSFVIGDKAYVGGGYGGVSTNYPTDFWEYNPATDSWKQIADLPVGSQDGVTFTMDGKGYVCSGDTETEYNILDLWEYNPSADTWTQKADVPTSKSEGIGFSVNGRGFAGLGKTTAVTEYLPEFDAWVESKPSPKNFGYDVFSTFVINNEVYFLNPILTSDFEQVWKFDFSTNTWTQLNDFLFKDINYSAVAFVLNGQAYVGGGFKDNAVWKYDRANDTWERTVPMIGGWLQSSYSFTIGNKAYVGSTWSDGLYTDKKLLMTYTE